MHTRTPQHGKDVIEEVVVDGYEIMHGPKADRDVPCCLFPLQKLGWISKQAGPCAVGHRPGELLAQGCCWI